MTHTIHHHRSRGWAAAMVTIAGVALLTACSPAAGPAPAQSSAKPSATPTATSTPVPVATPVAGRFDATPSPHPTSYAQLGEFGRWAKTIDRLYGLQPNYKDWNDVADLNCGLQKKGDTQGMYGPDSTAGLAADEVTDKAGRTIHPVSGEIWAASILFRCPKLLDTPPVHTQAEEKLAGLDWVEPGWQKRLTQSATN